MKNCIVCQGQAEVFCHQDDAYLCLTCDEQVHSANVLARRHQRTKLCELCTSAPSTVYCKNDKAHLCATCDVEAHTGIVNSRHERVPVTATAAPAEVEEGDGCSQVKGGDARSEVNNMDDGTDDSLWAVPDGSTSALARPSATVDDFPDWNRTSLPIDAKSLLGEEFQQEMDIFDLDPTWLDRLDMGFDDLTDSLLDDLPCDMGGKPMLKRKGSTDAVHATSDNPSSGSPPCVPTFAPRPVKLQRVTPANIMSTAELLATYQDSNADAQQQVFQHHQPVPAQQMVPNHQESSVAVPMASYAAAPVPYTAAPVYHAAPVVEAAQHHAHHRDHRFMAQPLEVEKIDVSTYIPRSLQPSDPATAAARVADRAMRLNRFREKKKNRQFKKTIRYASRKAYAEVRPRIKGRFARKDEVVAMRAAGVLPQLAA